MKINSHKHGTDVPSRVPMTMPLWVWRSLAGLRMSCWHPCLWSTGYCLL